jgi:hypothetical protein
MKRYKKILFSTLVLLVSLIIPVLYFGHPKPIHKQEIIRGKRNSSEMISKTNLKDLICICR